MITREALYDAIDKYVIDDMNVIDHWKDNDLTFREISYSIWAAKELKSYLDKNPGVDIYIVISLFIKRMSDYSCMSSSGISKHMFSVGEEVGNYFLDNVMLK